MSQSVTIDSKITIPPANNTDTVSVELVEDGAVQIAYGIDLYPDATSTKQIAKFPSATSGQSFVLDTGATLRGMQGMDCFGRVFLAGTDTVKLHCDFLAGGKVIASSDTASIELTSANPSREFHLRCTFV